MDVSTIGPAPLLLAGGIMVGTILLFSGIEGDPVDTDALVRWDHAFDKDGTRVWAVQVLGEASWVGVEVRTSDGIGVPYRHEGGDERIDLGEGMSLFGDQSRHHDALVVLNGARYVLVAPPEETP